MMMRFHDDATLMRVATALLKRRRAGDLPPLWCNRGVFTLQWPTQFDLYALTTAQAERLAAGLPIPEALSPPKPKRRPVLPMPPAKTWHGRRAQMLWEIHHAATGD